MKCRVLRLKGRPLSVADEGIEATTFETISQLAKYCAKEIREGRMVAFPTETVYGLGANGIDADAVEKIFEVKGRPKSDPCILHVSGEPSIDHLLYSSQVLAWRSN